VFENAGAFFAFSDDQFNESAKLPPAEYCALPGGLICPKVNVKTLHSEMNRIQSEGIAQDLAENGKDAIIRRELYNHEIGITWDTRDTVLALQDYSISEEEIEAVFDGMKEELCQ